MTKDTKPESDEFDGEPSEEEKAFYMAIWGKDWDTEFPPEGKVRETEPNTGKAD